MTRHRGPRKSRRGEWTIESLEGRRLMTASSVRVIHAGGGHAAIRALAEGPGQARVGAVSGDLVRGGDGTDRGRPAVAGGAAVGPRRLANGETAGGAAVV